MLRRMLSATSAPRFIGFTEEAESLKRKREKAIERLGGKWIGHPEKRIKRLEEPR